RRDASDDVIARQEDVADLQTNLARAVPRRVVHPVSVADEISVSELAIRLDRSEEVLRERVHLGEALERRLVDARPPQAHPEILAGDDPPPPAVRDHPCVQLAARDAR